MNSAYMSGQSSPNINFAINPDPRFMIWKTSNPAIYPSQQLPAWSISTTGTAHVDMTKLTTRDGLKISASNSGTFTLKSSLLSNDDLANMLGKTVTLSAKFSEAIGSLELSLLKGNTVIMSSSYSTSSDFFILSGTLAESYIDPGELVILAKFTSPLIAKIEYIKLEFGDIATVCPIRAYDDEINMVNSRYNGYTIGVFGKSKYRTDMTGITIDINNYNLSDGKPEMFSGICRTISGASNISNLPVNNIAFILDVSLIKWSSSADYVSRQVLVSSVDSTAYVRHCINGTWSVWETLGKGDAVIELNNKTDMHFWVGTYAEYLALGTAVDNSIIYIVTDLIVGDVQVSVPQTRKINGHNLTQDVVLSMSDINIVDDDTGKIYTLGVKSGALYIREVI